MATMLEQMYPDKLREVEFGALITLLEVNDAEEYVQFQTVAYTRYYDPDRVKPMEGAADMFVHEHEWDGFVPYIFVEDYKDAMNNDFTTVTRVNYATAQIWTSVINTVTVTQNMDFRRFPFDMQYLTITFLSTNCKLRPWNGDLELLGFPPLKEKEKDDPKKQDASFVVYGAPDNWKLDNLEVYFVKEKEGERKLLQGACQVVCIAKRKPMYYFLSYCVVVYFIVATNICVISIDPSDAADRHGVSLTLLLTLVAFKYVISEGVTKTSYLTVMDFYVFTLFIFVMMALMENVAVSSVGQNYLNSENDAPTEEEASEKVQDTDFIFHVTFFSVWSFFHLVILGLVIKPNLTLFDRSKNMMIAMEAQTERRGIMRTGEILMIDENLSNQPEEVQVEAKAQVEAEPELIGELKNDL